MCMCVGGCVGGGGRGGGGGNIISAWTYGYAYLNRSECICILYTSVLLYPCPPTQPTPCCLPPQKAKHHPRLLLHAATLCPSLSLGRTCDQHAPTEGLCPLPSPYLACESSRSSPVREWTLWFCRGFPSPRVVASMNFWGMLILLMHTNKSTG